MRLRFQSTRCSGSLISHWTGVSRLGGANSCHLLRQSKQLDSATGEERDKSKHVRGERNPLCPTRHSLSHPGYVSLHICSVHVCNLPVAGIFPPSHERIVNIHGITLDDVWWVKKRSGVCGCQLIYVYICVYANIFCCSQTSQGLWCCFEKALTSAALLPANACYVHLNHSGLYMNICSIHDNGENRKQF